MSDPIPDKAQVSIDFPHKFYMGSFGRESRFDVTADKEGVHVHLDRPGQERRHAIVHPLQLGDDLLAEGAVTQHLAVTLI